MSSDDLTPLERQLAACRPSAAGLDPDAMLFEAGRASARRRSLVWPAVAAGFAGLSLALSAGLMTERSERFSLAERLVRVTAVAEAPRRAVEPLADLAPDSYLAARRAIDRDVDAWQPREEPSPEWIPPVPDRALRAWGTMLEQ